MSACVYLLDYKGNLDPINPDVIKRHQAYGKAFRSITQEWSDSSKIVALGRYSSRNCPRTEELEIVNIGGNSSMISYLLGSYRIIKEQKSQQVGLIAGDPWISTLVAIILRTFLNRKVLIECQVHFDYTKYFESQNLIKRILLSSVTPRVMKRANQIRVVDLQTLEILKSKFEAKIPIYFAPSTLNLDINYNCSQRSESEVVKLIWVGRLHSERNPIDFANLLVKLHESNFSFKAKIIGSGPLERQLSSSLSTLIDANLVEIVGEKFGAELYLEYCTSDILVSSAAHESYGRTLREAIFFGAKVLSTRTAGFNLLATEVENDLIRSYDSFQSTEDLIDKINWLRSQKVKPATKKYILESQQIILHRLAMHWAYLVDSRLA